jgi:protein-arginine kinase activator protein McsA
MGKEVKSLEDQLTEALKREDYAECARIQEEMQDQKIKDLLK